ncbi:MAG: hypothetical protein AAB323_01285 [Pseudomonadota bacterium]
MLAIILATTLFARGMYTGSDARPTFNPRRAPSAEYLEKQAAKYEKNRSKFEAWRAKADTDAAKRIKAEVRLTHQKERLERLQKLGAEYSAHKAGMEAALAKIAEVNTANVVAATQEVVAAESRELIAVEPRPDFAVTAHEALPFSNELPVMTTTEVPVAAMMPSAPMEAVTLPSEAAAPQIPTTGSELPAAPISDLGTVPAVSDTAAVVTEQTPTLAPAPVEETSITPEFPAVDKAAGMPATDATAITAGG